MSELAGPVCDRHTGHEEPFVQLAAAVVYRAVLDAKSQRDEADAAFVWLVVAPLARFLCDGAGVPHTQIVRAVKAMRGGG